MRKTVVTIVGPTAVGKTSLSIEIAKKLDGEIISGDSMQVYKGLDIGTAKIAEEEMQGVPHHMIDIINPDVSFSVADFQQLVRNKIEEIYARDKLPIIVGGSGLYIQAALFDYHFSDQRRDPIVTNRLEQWLKKDGATALHNRLQEIDPQQAKKIHPNNHRRLIRALEIYETTGMTMSAYQQQQKQEPLYNTIFIGLETDRKQLYNRINKRVDQMLEKGLIHEVRTLYDNGYETYQSMRGIGYKEFIAYFQGQQTLDETIALLKRNSRRYAKRQYTWFKNKVNNVHWYLVEPGTETKKFSVILQDLAGMLGKK